MTEFGSRHDDDGWLKKLLRRLPRSTRFLILALVLSWATLAIYYSMLPWKGLRVTLAIAFAAFGIWALWFTRRPRMRWVFAALYLVVLVGWSFIRPSHDRERRADVAVMPRALQRINELADQPEFYLCSATAARSARRRTCTSRIAPMLGAQEKAPGSFEPGASSV